MAEFLLELLSEEIPARMQGRAADELARLFTDKLKDARLQASCVRTFVTPRRLALVADGLPDRQPDLREERRGPRVDAPEKAILGFLGAVGLTLEQCEQRDMAKGTFLFAVIEKPGVATAELLAEVVPELVRALSWPKSMRWAGDDLRYVRPLRSLLCLFDGRPVAARVPLGYGAALSAQGATVGHRFMAPAQFAVADFADYQRKLLDAKVMLDPAARRDAIRTQAMALAAGESLVLKQDPALLDEVAGLVEWPVVHMGRIDDAFMALPPEVMTSTMRANQKYFTLQAPDGSMAPRFILVANIDAADGGAAIVAGNERVLRARLSDAQFFWEQDRNSTLASRVPAPTSPGSPGCGSGRRSARRCP